MGLSSSKNFTAQPCSLRTRRGGPAHSLQNQGGIETLPLENGRLAHELEKAFHIYTDVPHINHLNFHMFSGNSRPLPPDPLILTTFATNN